MTVTQQIITIALCALATMATRFLPFLVFSGRRPTPPFVQYLGQVLPAAIFGMLVIYCFRGLDFTAGSRGVPELLAAAVVIGLHLWKRRMILSIAGGTVFYMLLVQLIF